MHEDFFTDLQEIVENGKADSLVRAAPRGNAKSTIASFALVLWVSVYQKKHFVLITSDTMDQAQDFLSHYRNELEDNDRIKEDFGDLVGSETWNQTDTITSLDVRVQALGAGKKVRGRRHKQWRPDLIICDDLENDENIASLDQRQKMETWFNKALSNAGDSYTDKIVVGTIMHTDSLLSKVLRNPLYDSKTYKAVISWSASSLWDQWEGIITELENPRRILDAKTFFENNKEEMLKGTQVQWPEKETYYDLMVHRVAIGPSAFSSEKQNEPLSAEDQRFLPEWFRYFDDSEIAGQKLIILGFCDPSLGKKTGDYSAIITAGVNRNGVIYILDADIMRRRPDIIISDVLLKHDTYKYSKFGVEENQFQEFFKDELVKKANESKRELSILGVRQHSDKILRIESLQPGIKNGRIRFRRDQQTLINQLLNFPLADHDDGPDALEGVVSLVSTKSAVAQYYEEAANEKQSTDTVSIQKQILQGTVKSIGWSW